MARQHAQGRFVILEHRWRGVHWDFMLEDDGVLRTWAVDEPIVANVELPARALPDHRMLYLAYEGPISGGRGSVRRMEEGFYTTREWSEDRVRVTIEGVQLVGDVDLYRVALDSTAGSTWKFRLGKVD
jgi:hypothetical protein